MKTMVTRTGYCEKCYKAKRPHAGNHFLVYGGTTDEMYLEDVKPRNAIVGFTPHIFLKISVSDDNQTVTYRKICTMCDCGAIHFPDEEDEDKSTGILNEEEWSEELQMPTFRWNALVMYKDESLKI